MTAAVSGDLIEIDYRITAENPRAIADAIRVEQTIEFPFELAPEWIQQDVVGQVLNDDGSDITIGYDPGVAGGGHLRCKSGSASGSGPPTSAPRQSSRGTRWRRCSPATSAVSLPVSTRTHDLP